MRYCFLAIGMLGMVACGGGSSSSDPTPAVKDPGKPLLVLPARGEACNNGEVVTDTSSIVTFRWNAAGNTESYEVAVKNLLTNVKQGQTTNDTTLRMQLKRATPYGWTVTAKSTKTTVVTASDVWKFYNSGDGLTYYAPFPAEFVNADNSGGKVKLVWKGSDADNYIVGYDVYFGTSMEPGLYRANVKDMQLSDVPVSSGTTYYWMVLTKDQRGNSAKSEVFRLVI